MRVQFLGQKDPLEKGIATHSSILPGKFHGQRSLLGYSSGVTKSQTPLSNSHTPINYEMTMISILATSHRLPSRKTYISSRLLSQPLSFQKGCSRKLQTGIQPAEMQRDSVQWARLYQRCSSVQFSRSVMSDSLQHHELQHARPPCPSPTPGVHSDSRPSSQ